MVWWNDSDLYNLGRQTTRWFGANRSRLRHDETNGNQNINLQCMSSLINIHCGHWHAFNFDRMVGGLISTAMKKCPVSFARLPRSSYQKQPSRLFLLVVPMWVDALMIFENTLNLFLNNLFFLMTSSLTIQGSIGYNAFCYGFFETKTSWSDAEETCVNKSGHLATVNDR